ncbi:MAG: DUF1622 domain-containing protein [Clostridia bacterium]|nr:DUF1622 domain-containing protein [Clostridia bacterium]
MFTKLITLGILTVELIGVLALFAAVGSGVVGFFKKDRELRLKLAEGIGLSLEFKMGSELLRTVIVRNFSELAILGAVIVLRAALALLIEWEIRNERSNIR